MKTKDITRIINNVRFEYCRKICCCNDVKRCGLCTILGAFTETKNKLNQVDKIIGVFKSWLTV